MLEHIPNGGIKAGLSLPGAKLITKNRYGLVRECALHIDREIIIGRYMSNDIVINGIGISRVHAKIRPEEEGYILYDMASRGGTYVNGSKIERHCLENDDEISIGHVEIIFKKDILD